MEPIYSLLTFPQKYEAGILYFNILVLPRNSSLVKPIDANLPAFVDNNFLFDLKIINELDGLPLFSAVTQTNSPVIDSPVSDKRAIIKEIIRQMEQNDDLKISENQSENLDYGAKKQINDFAAKNVAIKKYLPETYRTAFNFTSPKTRFAVTDDEYECIIKNKDKKLTDPLTQRKFISWGKLVAFILRNPLIAERAGFIYKAHITLDEGIFKKGGWLFTQFAAESSYSTVNTSVYAARIPTLKNKRNLFASVLFPVKDAALNNATYDAVMQESILYNDGFAKIVHVNQPINQDLLQEKDSSNPPVLDIGLRLGWDDEQLIIWGNRQLRQKDEITELPIDAPLGVFGYKVDVRELGDERWFSQNQIKANQDIILTAGNVIAEAGQSFELPVEVHPSSHGNTMEEGFWLPMYFASWNGKTMVIPNKEAEEIYHSAKERILVPGLDPQNSLNTQPKKTFHLYRQDENHHLSLIYGHDYEFRIRMMDISGGGPSSENEPLNGGQKPIAQTHFTRNIKAEALNILNISEHFNAQNSTFVQDTSILENILDDASVLRVKRPDLSYPSVLYTGKYSNAALLLKNKIDSISVPGNPMDRSQYSVGLPDPDVKSFKVVVEIKSLEMDNVRSVSGKEAYYIWKEKIFSIPFDAEQENYDLEREINIVYRDFQQILPNDEEDDFDLILPTSRHLRLSFIPLVDGAAEEGEQADYASHFVREGASIILTAFKAAAVETHLLSEIKGGLRAFYLQPEEKPELSALSAVKLNATKTLVSTTSVELKRLAEALDLASHQSTLEGNTGQRVQFGVNHEIRHSLAPESGSVNFSSVKELFNRWIIAFDYSLLRDWSWQGLKEDSFTVYRKIKTVDAEEIEVGSIQLKDVANMTMLNQSDRGQSRILFLDSIDPKKYQKDFPREMSVEYRIKPNLKKGYEETEVEAMPTITVDLPITTIPHQIPKLLSAGVARTPYDYDHENYRYSTERQKYLWFEFETPPEDPDDTYFARVLAYAPDPYLCRVDNQLINEISEDLPFNINEEKIREIIPNMTNDSAGMGVMQELIPENAENTKSYLLPLPSGLHSESDDLFGFFTYEIRLGHKKEAWSTAKARYGRPLRVNGVQHPAPELNCSAYRFEKNTFTPNSEKFIEISATHANAVSNGENVTAFPPNTSLWFLLYTQVMQADGKSFRNLLIDSGPMFYDPKGNFAMQGSFKKESGNRKGSAVLSVKQIGDKLHDLGLPRSNNLSAIAVEMFPLDNNWQYVHEKFESSPDAIFMEQYIRNRDRPNPLTDQLGQFRIYRSSKLISITEVCCEDC